MLRVVLAIWCTVDRALYTLIGLENLKNGMILTGVYFVFFKKHVFTVNKFNCSFIHSFTQPIVISRLLKYHFATGTDARAANTNKFNLDFMNFALVITFVFNVLSYVE